MANDWKLSGPYLGNSDRDDFMRYKSLMDEINAVKGTSTGLPGKPTKHRFMECLMTRLRVPEGQKLPFEYIDLHIGKSQVFVFIVNNGNSVVLEDNVDMFPSDTIVSSIQLIRG